MSRLTITRHRTLAEVIERTAQRVERGVQAVAQKILADSLEMVPRDTEALAESATYRQEGVGLASVVVVGYGALGFIVAGHSPHENRLVLRVPYNYAVYVHEDYTKHHPVGQAGFLELAAADHEGLRTVLNVTVFGS